MSDIATLRANIKRLEQELRDAKDALHSALVDLTGVPIGTIVRGTRRRAGKIFRVTGHSYIRDDGKCWLEGNPQRADGSFGTSVRSIYDDWERIEP